MNNERVVHEVRKALELSDTQLVEIFAGLDVEISPADLEALQNDCPDGLLAMFLDGLILQRRGPPKGKPGPTQPNPDTRVDNNVVLKKLRIALDMKEPQLLAALARGGLEMTNRELTPYYRKRGNKHYKSCPDAVLEALFAGL